MATLEDVDVPLAAGGGWVRRGWLGGRICVEGRRGSRMLSQRWPRLLVYKETWKGEGRTREMVRQ